MEPRIQIGIPLIVIGIMILLAGIWLVLGIRFPFGNLPGDIHFGGRNWQVHIPLMTMLIVSLVLTIILNLFFRR